MPVEILVLGGTRFIGRAFVDIAQSRDHKLTLFNRGRSDSRLFASVPHVFGDRGDRAAVAQLAGREWDCILDISGYRPDQVRPILEVAGGATRHYVYISTVSVYAEPMPPGAPEDAPVLKRYSAGEFRQLLGRFRDVRIVPERFPVKSRLHGGWKGALYNLLFVSAFNALPRPLVRRFGWHLLAFCTK